MKRTGRRLSLPAVGLLLLAAGCGSDGEADSPTNAPNPDTRTATPPPDGAAGPAEADGTVAATDLLTGLESPWGIATFDDGSYLVGSRDTGVISLVTADDPGAATPVRTIDVRAEGESGLLGLATTAEQDTVLAYYTTDDDSRVVRMTWDGTTLGEPEVIVEGIPGGETYHQGGGLAVGPDGLLYVSTGDNGVPDNAQDRDSLSGKVLRYTLDGDPAPDNPFGSPVYSYGHRNVEGLAFDDRGRLWASEFGQNQYDELNLIEPGSNYGWPVVEGTGGGAEYVDPQAVWTTAEASPSGLAYLDGSLWMGALRGQTLWEIPLLPGDDAGPGRAEEPVAHLAGEYGRIRAVHVAPEGTSLLVGTSNTDGRGEPTADDDRILSVTR